MRIFFEKGALWGCWRLEMTFAVLAEEGDGHVAENGTFVGKVGCLATKVGSGATKVGYLPTFVLIA